MDAGKKVLLDLFTGSLRFTVPVYQRRYSWGEAQCRQLWTDIVTAGRHPDRTHFTGSVVWIVFLQVGVHSMGTIFRQHRRLVSKGRPGKEGCHRVQETHRRHHARTGRDGRMRARTVRTARDAGRRGRAREPAGPRVRRLRPAHASGERSCLCPRRRRLVFMVK